MAFQMLEYKRNQVEESISHLLEPTSPQPTQGLRTKVKRLLEADRALHASAGANGGNFAFFSAEPPGRGVEIWFSAYEAFALLTGLRLTRRVPPWRTTIRGSRLPVRQVRCPDHQSRDHPVSLMERQIRRGLPSRTTNRVPRLRVQQACYPDYQSPDRRVILTARWIRRGLPSQITNRVIRWLAERAHCPVRLPLPTTNLAIRWPAEQVHCQNC